MTETSEEWSTDVTEIRDRRHTAWFWADKAVIDTYGPTIGAYGVAVYMLLARYVDARGQAYPSLTTIGARLGMSRRKVITTLEALVACGLIAKEMRHAPHGGLVSNVFTLLHVPTSPSTTPEGLQPQRRGGGAPQTQGVVHHMHGGSAPHAPGGCTTCTGVVHHMHGGSAPHAPKQDPEEQDPEEQVFKPPPSPSTPPGTPLTGPLLDSDPASVTSITTPEAFLALYNANIPAGIPEAKTLSPERRQRITKYLQDFPDRLFWITCFRAPATSPFLRGERAKPGHERFKFDLDFLLRKGKDGIENCVKVSEGKYADQPPQDHSPPETSDPLADLSPRMQETVRQAQRGYERMMNNPRWNPAVRKEPHDQP